MKKKFGFTLAEVLITLGIIGVVAALTAPALVKNSGTAKIADNGWKVSYQG
jgi:prepilin-type N-terminal cleavage/methylation domain-containing protein